MKQYKYRAFTLNILLTFNDNGFKLFKGGNTMKKVLKGSLSLVLALTIIFSSAIVGLSEVDFGSFFAVETKAASIETLVPDQALTVSWDSGEKFLYVSVAESGFYNVTIDSDYNYYYSEKVFCRIYNDEVEYYIGADSEGECVPEFPYTFSNLYLEADSEYVMELICYDVDYDEYCGGEVTISLTQTDYAIKKLSSSSTKVIADENEYNWFSVETKSAGDYLISFGGDVSCVVYDVATRKEYTYCWYYNSTVKLEANKKYILLVWYCDANPTPHNISFNKQTKTVKKIDLHNVTCKPNYFEPEYFDYKVTYTDGTSEIVNYYFFSNRGVRFYVDYIGEYTDDVYMKVGKQKVKIQYNDTVYTTYVKIISFAEYYSYLDPVSPDETMRISYEGDSYYEYVWNVKVPETGKYELRYYGSWVFSEWEFRIFDINNEEVPYENGAWSLKEGEKYCFMFGYEYEDYYTNDFRFLISADTDHTHQYSGGVCKGCGHWKNKAATLKTNSVANSASGVTVKWTALAGAEGYKIYRKTGSGGWKLIDTVKGGSKTSYTDKTVKNGTTYTYTVRGYNGNSLSKYNKTGLSIKYVATPKLTKIANGNKYVQVTWSKVGGADGYIIYRKASGESKWTKLTTVKGGSTVTYKDKSVSSGKNYTYTVRAYDGKVNSSYDSKGITTKYLATPTLSSVSSSKSGITFKWGKVTGASGYIVYRKTGNGGWQQIATVKGNTKVSYLDKTAKKGTTYTYTVKAYNGNYRSAHNGSGLKIKDKY